LRVVLHGPEGDEEKEERPERKGDSRKLSGFHEDSFWFK